MKSIFLHRYAGVLSAYGMGLADIRSICEAVVETKLSAATITAENNGSNSTVEESFKNLCEKAKNEILAQGIIFWSWGIDSTYQSLHFQNSLKKIY